MKKLSFLALACGFLLALIASSSRAQNATPEVLVKSVTTEVLSIIRQNKDPRDGNAKKIAELVETRILPHFDFTRMTQLAMGRNWRAASPEQQKAITAEFKTLVVHIYSASLTNYRDQTIEFLPLRMAPGETEVTVSSVVKQSGAQPIAIAYKLAQEPSGWKVYNVTIDGVSLIITYRDTFANLVRDRGVDGLIRALATKNRQNDAPA